MVTSGPERGQDPCSKDRIWEECHSTTLASPYKRFHSPHSSAIECAWCGTVHGYRQSAKPIWLHADNNDDLMLKRIKAGLYTHILFSPEIACSLKFYEQVLSSTWFRKRIKAVVIDEIHLVVDWGRAFRKAYSLSKSTRQQTMVWVHCNPGSGLIP
jgi:hypothetical protein